MRILHLGYEDPAQPGSGGGSARTREINRRLSARHEITVLVAGYPGAEPRVEDGVHWQPLGPHSGLKLDRLAYFALLGPAIGRYPHDLLIEDFGAPFSTAFSPLYTRRPVIASVQWLFASQMRSKYHLPFDMVEELGLKLYHNLIVVSGWLGETVQARLPDARIWVVPNGVEDAAFAAQPAAPRHLLFLGRLDIVQKGGDLLVQIIARARELLGERMPPLLIAGDGPDRPAMEQMIRRYGLEGLVEMCGRVDGPAKYELMASAYAVLMPSRFETFGMVAVESQAAGAPLIAFDVGPLREVAGGAGARLVRPFDVDAFAHEVADIVSNQADRGRLQQSGRQWARRYDWNAIAREQEAVYLDIAGERRIAPAEAVNARA
jgi:glycogen synthase